MQMKAVCVVCRYGIYVHDWMSHHDQIVSDKTSRRQCSCTHCLLLHCIDCIHGCHGSRMSLVSISSNSSDDC